MAAQVNDDDDESDNDESPTMATLSSDDQQQMTTISVEDYLQQVLDAVGPYQMIITEQHRKLMIRCLLGYRRKVDFDLRLQNLQLEQQWGMTAQFVREQLIYLEVDASKAPMFQDGLTLHLEGHAHYCWRESKTANQTITHSPAKFFSYISRGRTYQGKLERLLEDVGAPPEYLETYQAILRTPTELELMRRLILQETTTSDGDDSTNSTKIQWKDQLLELVEKEFGDKGPSQPEDGGKQLGLQGELDLSTFLQERIASANTGTTTKENPPFVLTNVLVKPTNKHLRQCKQQNNPNKKLQYVIAANVDLMGLTSEFDAMVVATTSDKTTIRMLELWEAKASLHPITIYDVLFKKVSALQLILNDPGTFIYFYPDKDDLALRKLLTGDTDEAGQQQQDEDLDLVFPLDCTPSAPQPDEESALNNNGSAKYKNLPQIGIFGSELMCPVKAARRTQFVHCERLLEKDPKVVLEAISTGVVAAPDVKPHLETMLAVARQLQATLVVMPSPPSN